MWAGLTCFLSGVDGYVGELHELQQGCEKPWKFQRLGVISLKTPELMGLISPGWDNLIDFLELWQVLSSYDGYLRDPLSRPQERPVPMRVARGPLGIPLP